MGTVCERHYCECSKPKKTNPEWMSKLPDSLRLIKMSIPGTHNSCSLFGPTIALTQSWPLDDQLEAGIRFFDIRLRAIDNTLRLQHGIISQKYTFDTVLHSFITFLDNHKNECIIMAVQDENTVSNCTKDFKQLFEEYTQNIKDRMILFKGGDYLLKDIRGKILYINMIGNYMKNNSIFRVQNDWVVNFYRNIKEKKKKIKTLFNRAVFMVNDGYYYVNFLSGVSDYGFVVPSKCAYITNQLVFKYSGRLGIVLLDFPGEDLIDYIISNNSYFSKDEYLNHPLQINSNNTNSQNNSEQKDNDEVNLLENQPKNEKIITENEEFYSDDSILKSNMKVKIIHINTNKYLDVGDDLKLYCSKKENVFKILNTHVNKKNNNNDDDDKIMNKSKITLIGKNNSSYDLNIKRSNNKNYKLKRKLTQNEEKFIHEYEPIHLYLKGFSHETSEKFYSYLSSDYFNKTFFDKMQITSMSYYEIETKNDWYIKISN